MRVISNLKDKKLREEQFNVLVEVIELIKNRGDLRKFLHCFLSESEAAYLGQRIDVMRMLAKNFNYTEIKEEIGVPANTISKAQKCLDEAGDELKQIILSYRYKPVKPKVKEESFRLPHYPGAIKI